MEDTDDGILECDQCGRMMEIPKARTTMDRYREIAVESEDGIPYNSPQALEERAREQELNRKQEEYEKALYASPFTQGDVDEMIASGFLKPEKKARLNTKALEDIDNLQVWSTRLSAAVTSNEKRLSAFDDIIARLEKKVAELTQDLEHERNQKIERGFILGELGARGYSLENPVVEAKTEEKTTACLNSIKDFL